jgi:hypothetical protein
MKKIIVYNALFAAIIFSGLLLPINGDVNPGITASYPNSVVPPSSFTMNVYVSNAQYSKDAIHSPIITIYTGDPSYISIVGPSSKTWQGSDIPPNGQVYNCGQFTIQVASNTPPGSYSIVVEIRYNYGAFYANSGSKTVTLPLQVQSQMSSSSYWDQTTQMILPYAIVIILIGIVAIFIIRSRKR